MASYRNPLHIYASLDASSRRQGRVVRTAFVLLGNEGRMLRNGSLLMSRIFASGEEALAWAEEERQRMLGHDWNVA